MRNCRIERLIKKLKSEYYTNGVSDSEICIRLLLSKNIYVDYSSRVYVALLMVNSD